MLPLFSDEIPPAALCPGVFRTRMMWICWSGRPRRWSEGWDTSAMRKGRELCLVSLEKAPLGSLILMGTDFLVRPVSIGHGGMVLS